MTKLTRNLIIFSSAVVVAAFLMAGALLTTETGSRWLVYRLVSYVPEKLVIKNIGGNLLSGLSLYDVSLDSNMLKTSIMRVEFNWRLLSLLGGTLHIANLHMKGISLYLPSFEETLPVVAARISKEISLPVTIILDRARLEGIDIHWDKKLYELKQLYLSGRADKNGIRFERFKAFGQGTRLNFKGHTGLQKPYPFKGNIDWDTMFPDGLPVKGECFIEGNVQGGKATFKLDSPFVLETNVELKANNEWTKFSVIGKHKDVQQPILVQAPHLQSATNLYFNQLEFRTLGGSITFDGYFNCQPEPIFDFSIHGENINPGILLPNLPGKLKFQSRLQGRIKDKTKIFSFSELKVLGRLLGRPFESSGSLVFQDSQPKMVDTDILVGNNRLTLSKASDKNLDLQFNLEVLEPESLWPGLGGQWRGKGYVRPIANTPVGVLALEGNDITYGNFSIEGCQGSFTCDSVDTQKCSALVKLTNLVVDDELFSSLSVDWKGNLKKHRVKVNLVAPSERVNLEFAGECFGDAWNIKIDKASFDLDDNETWRLNNHPVNVHMSHTGIKPFKTCWEYEESSECVNSSWSVAAGWKTIGNLDALPVDRMIDILKTLIQRPKLDKELYKAGDINYR